MLHATRGSVSATPMTNRFIETPAMGLLMRRKGKYYSKMHIAIGL
jgi:hypothetical protein